jgi:uncharacterized protein YPO0396
LGRPNIGVIFSNFSLSSFIKRYYFPQEQVIDTLKGDAAVAIAKLHFEIEARKADKVEFNDIQISLQLKIAELEAELDQYKSQLGSMEEEKKHKTEAERVRMEKEKEKNWEKMKEDAAVVNRELDAAEANVKSLSVERNKLWKQLQVIFISFFFISFSFSFSSSYFIFFY